MQLIIAWEVVDVVYRSAVYLWAKLMARFTSVAHCPGCLKAFTQIWRVGEEYRRRVSCSSYLAWQRWAELLPNLLEDWCLCLVSFYPPSGLDSATCFTLVCSWPWLGASNDMPQCNFAGCCGPAFAPAQCYHWFAGIPLRHSTSIWLTLSSRMSLGSHFD